MSDEKNESKKANQDLPLGFKVLITGFVGGLFWGIIWYVAYFFNFTDVGPNLLWKAWTLGSWSEEATGQWIAISLLAILSIGVAFFLQVCVRKDYEYVGRSRVWGFALGNYFFTLVILCLSG